MTFVSDSTAEQLPIGTIRCIKCNDIIDQRFIPSHEARDCKSRHADYMEDEMLTIANQQTLRPGT